MKLKQNCYCRHKRRMQQGMTLMEVLVAFVISAVSVAGIVNGYVYAIGSAERFSLSQAADAKASERMEEIRSAKWDTSSYPAVDQLQATNFPDVLITLDLSGSGGFITYATNKTQITVISTSPPLKRVRVDCIWATGRSGYITNSIETVRSPDQ